VDNVRSGLLRSAAEIEALLEHVEDDGVRDLHRLGLPHRDAKGRDRAA
jgi:hypothetical protein